jgi:hypothetical protein
MTYDSPAWKFEADFQLLKLQSLQNKCFHTMDNFLKCTPVRKLCMALEVLCTYSYIKELSRQQAEVIQNHENASVRDIGKGEA